MKKTNFELVLYYLREAQRELKKEEHDQLGSSLSNEHHWLIIDEAIEALIHDISIVKQRWEGIDYE